MFNILVWATTLALLGFVGFLWVDDKLRKFRSYQKIKDWWKK